MSIPRYGFNTQEKEDEIAEGIYTAKFWMYDSRLGRRWNLDPKGITGISEYGCFANNPVFYTDHGGDTISICYYVEMTDEATGETYMGRENYVYGSGIELPNSQYVKDIVASIDYLLANEAGTIKGTDINVITNLVSMEETVTIVEIDGMFNRFDDNQRAIFYNSRGGLTTTEGGNQSPALGLLHELGHAYGYFFEKEKYNKRVATSDEDYDNKEEKFVIEMIEAPSAEILGEAIRTNHDGTDFVAEGPTSTVKAIEKKTAAPSK